MSFNATDYKLDKDDSSTPLYRQLKTLLLEKISEGKLQPGDQIPTEHELCKAFSISRTPVRQALKELVNEGVLSRRQGSGTFVGDINKLGIKLNALITEKQWGPPLTQAVERYNSRPDATFISLHIETLGRPLFYERILSSIGRGEAPDIALMDSAWVTEFAAYHFIESLNNLDGDWTNHLQKQLLTPFIDRNCYRGNLYALQPEANVSLLWYRKDEFRNLGLEPPKSWPQLVKVTKKLKDHGWKYPLAFAAGTSAGETTTYQLLPFIWSAGGAVLRSGKVALEDGGVKAVSFLTELVHHHKVASPEVHNYSWDQPIKLFAQGDVAMAFGGSYEKNRLLQYGNWDQSEFWEKVGWVALPGPKKGQQSATAGGMVYVILCQADYPKIAADILKEVMNPESVLHFCAENDRIPTTNGVLQALDPDKARFPHQAAALLDHAQSPPGHVQYASVSEQLQLMLERAIMKQMSPSQSVRKAAEVIDALS